MVAVDTFQGRDLWEDRDNFYALGQSKGLSFCDDDMTCLKPLPLAKINTNLSTCEFTSFTSSYANLLSVVIHCLLATIYGFPCLHFTSKNEVRISRTFPAL